MRQTTMAKPADVTRTWYVVDGNGQTLGRLASTCAHVLKGKHKPTYTPNVDCGDYVIVINADKVEMTGNKLNTEKYYNHSGYFGGMRVRTAKEMKEKYPVEWVERAIKAMASSASSSACPSLRASWQRPNTTRIWCRRLQSCIWQ